MNKTQFDEWYDVDIDVFINNMNIYENDAYFQPITVTTSMKLHSDTVEDVATVSNFREVVVETYDFSLDVDFNNREINGNVALTFTCKSATEIGNYTS